MYVHRFLRQLWNYFDSFLVIFKDIQLHNCTTYYVNTKNKNIVNKNKTNFKPINKE